MLGESFQNNLFSSIGIGNNIIIITKARFTIAGRLRLESSNYNTIKLGRNTKISRPGASNVISTDRPFFLRKKQLNFFF